MKAPRRPGFDVSLIAINCSAKTKADIDSVPASEL